MIKYFCDRCGKELTKEKYIGYIAVNIKDKPDGDLLGENEFEKNHYCQHCINSVKKFISKFEGCLVPEAAPEVAPANESEENVNVAPKTEGDSKNEENKRRKIDIGKIMALKNAGWPVKEIAGEMHLEPLQVSQAIYHYKKKHAEKVEVS